MDKQEFFEEATKPVSDLEEICDELDFLLRDKRNGTKEQRKCLAHTITMLRNSVEQLMSLDDEGNDG